MKSLWVSDSIFTHFRDIFMVVYKDFSDSSYLADGSQYCDSLRITLSLEWRVKSTLKCIIHDVGDSWWQGNMQKIREDFVVDLHVLLSSISCLIVSAPSAGGWKQSPVSTITAKGHHPCRDAEVHQVPLTVGQHCQVHRYSPPLSLQ